MKTYNFKNNKSGRVINVIFGYEADGDCFSSFADAQRYIFNAGKTPFSAFSTAQGYGLECDKPLSSGSAALSAEQKDIYVRKYLKEMENEGWTLLN